MVPVGSYGLSKTYIDVMLRIMSFALIFFLRYRYIKYILWPT